MSANNIAYAVANCKGVKLHEAKVNKKRSRPLTS